MNNDVLRDTLCDVAQLLDGWHADGTAWSEWDTLVRQKVSKAQALLEAANPADSDEPVDEQWLRSVGFYGKPANVLCVAIPGTRACLHCAIGIPVPSWALVDMVVIGLPAPKSRGDVRRLCHALGIDLRTPGEERR